MDKAVAHGATVLTPAGVSIVLFHSTIFLALPTAYSSAPAKYVRLKSLEPGAYNGESMSSSPEAVAEPVDLDGSAMTTDWPTLDSMGVTRHHEITHYTQRALDSKTDVLRIFYRRGTGSFLPVSRKYVFGRGTRTVVADSGSSRFEETAEISPVLLKAITELDLLLGNATAQAQSTAQDPQDVARMKVHAELDRLHDAVLGIAGDDDAEVLDERFASLRAQIDNL